MTAFSISNAPGLLAFSRFLAWCYLEAWARRNACWDAYPDLREFYRQQAFTAVVLDGMWRLELHDDWEYLSRPTAADDKQFLMSLAGVMEAGDAFQFPDDPACQQVTKSVVRRLRKIALRMPVV